MQKTNYFSMSGLFNALKIRFLKKYYLYPMSATILFPKNALLLSGLVLTLFAACNSGTDQEQPPIPDVSGVQVNAVIRRFDQDLFAMDTTRFLESMQALSAKYPAFLPFFIKEVAHDPTLPQEKAEDALYGFVTAQQVRRLNDSCQAAFPNMNMFQPELTQLLKYFKYYYPQRQEPVTVTAVTEFIGNVAWVNDTTMLVGLDFFLGSDFEGYNPDIFPQYLRNQFTKENMVVKYALELAKSTVPPPAQDHILDHMISNGKVLYIMDCLLPLVPDSIKMGYTTEQWNGCIANEQGTWARLLDMKVLYEPLSAKNMKIVTDGPSTDNVFQEAPGQVGNWIGWQIVKAYMKRFPKTDLNELANLTDAQQFVEKAKYKPRKQ
jgi:hypothetical protein